MMVTYKKLEKNLKDAFGDKIKIRYPRTPWYVKKYIVLPKEIEEKNYKVSNYSAAVFDRWGNCLCVVRRYVPINGMGTVLYDLE